MRGKTNMAWKLTAALMSIILLTTTMSGCGKYEKDKEKIAVTVLYQTGFENLKQLIESTYPEIELQYEKAPYDNEQTRRLEKGVGPDLLVFPQAMAGDDPKYLLDISDTKASMAYEATIMENMKMNGKTYLLPLPGQYMGYIINTTLFEKAGLSVPSSNQELVDSLASMRERGIGIGEDGINFTIRSGYNSDLGMFFTGCMVPDFLGDVDGINWLADFWNKESKFSGTWDRAFSLTEKMVAKGVLDPAAIAKKRNSIRGMERMGDGTLAAMFDGTDVLSAIQEENRSLVQAGKAEQYTYKMLPLFSDEGNKPWMIISPSAYIGINAAASQEKQEACRKILELLSTKEGQDAVLKDLQMGVSYLRNYKSDTDIISPEIEEYINSGYVYHVQFPDKIVEYLGSNSRQILSGKMSVSEALEALDNYYYNGSQDVDYDLSLIGVVEHDMLFQNYNVRREETEIGNLVADSVAEAAGAPIAVVNSGGIRGSLYKGETYGEDLAAVCPHDNEIVVLDISGQTVLDMLENSLSLYTEEFPYGRFLQVSGMRYTFDSRLPAGERVVEVTLNDGTKIDPDKTYTVAVNDYMAGRQGYSEGNGDDFTMLNVYSDDAAKDKAVLKKETGLTYRDAMALYFEKRNDSVVTAKLEGRITDLGHDE